MKTENGGSGERVCPPLRTTTASSCMRMQHVRQRHGRHAPTMSTCLLHAHAAAAAFMMHQQGGLVPDPTLSVPLTYSLTCRSLLRSVWYLPKRTAGKPGAGNAHGAGSFDCPKGRGPQLPAPCCCREGARLAGCRPGLTVEGRGFPRPVRLLHHDDVHGPGDVRRQVIHSSEYGAAAIHHAALHGTVVGGAGQVAHEPACSGWHTGWHPKTTARMRRSSWRLAQTLRALDILAVLDGRRTAGAARALLGSGCAAAMMTTACVLVLPARA